MLFYMSFMTFLGIYIFLYFFFLIYINVNAIQKVQSSNDSKSATNTSTLYFKLSFLKLSKFTQLKISMLAKKYCKNLNIRLAFSPFFKIKKFTYS